MKDPRDKYNIIQVVEECVIAYGDRIAVCHGDSVLTYHELNARANKLSHYLAARGVRCGDSVGIYLERSLELIIAILAVLKTGAVYVPLDPSYPQARIAFLLADAGIQSLITISQYEDDLKGYVGDRMCLDTLAGPVAGQMSCNPECRIKGESPACVMYTSGSTGSPKGVIIPHRAVVRLVTDTNYISFGADAVFLHISNTSFDGALFELWGALLNGAKLVIGSVRLPTLGQLGMLLEHHRVTVLFMTTALFNVVISETPQIFKSLKYLLVGGEALSLPHIRKALVGLPGVQLVNVYGPTENTTFTCCYGIPRNIPASFKTVPIGKSVTGTYVYILDTDRQPVADGETGELYIGGMGVALGYLNRPELTANVFFPDPYSEGKNRLLYKSGDRVRRMPDGNIEFLGRIDNQLKVRGYRVEPGEIENALNEHPGVTAVAVVPQLDPLGHMQLRAILTVNSETDVSCLGLKEFLKTKLPAFLIPESIEISGYLPMTPNGKIDREKLAAGYQSHTLYKLPHGKYWNRKSAGSTGGAAISQVSQKNDPELFTAREKGPIPLAGVQQRVFSWSKHLAQDTPAGHFQVALHLNGDLQVAVVEWAMATIVARHEIMRTTFSELDGVSRQDIHLPRKEDIVCIDLSYSSASREQYKKVVKECLFYSFQLDTLPLFHCRMVKLRHDMYVLIFVMHRIICDSYSFAVMLEEFVELYTLRVTGKAPGRHPWQIWQYADYALEEKSRWVGVARKRLERFWSGYLRGASHELLLSTADRSPATSAPSGFRTTTRLDEVLTRQLRLGARKCGMSLYTFMFAVFFLLLHRISGESEILIATQVANRPSEKTRKQLGMFSNIIPVRLTVSGKDSFEVFFRQARGRIDSALQHQSLPIEGILKAAGITPGDGEISLFRSGFSFCDAPMLELQFADISGTVEYLFNGLTPSDMHVTVLAEENSCHPYGGEHSSSLGLRLFWDYASDVYTKEQVLEIAESYAELLQEVVAADQQQLLPLGGTSRSPFFPGLKISDYRPKTEQGLCETVVEAKRERDVNCTAGGLCCKDRGTEDLPNLTEQLILPIWQEVTGVEHIQLHDDFFELGGDSLGAMVLMSRIFHQVGVEVPISVFFTRPTVAGLADMIVRNQSEALDVVLRMERKGPILFYFHGDYTGGGLYTRQLVASLKSGIDMVILHPHGQPGQPLPVSIERMAARYIESICSHQKHGPFYLAGHCNGALLAYEVARQLVAHGEVVRRLMLLDPAVPDFSERGGRPFTDCDVDYDGKTQGEMMLLDTAARKAILLNAYRKICGGYRLRRYAGAVCLILSEENRDMQSGGEENWRLHAGSLSVTMVPGGHLTMLTDYVEPLSQSLRSCILGC